MFAKQLTFQRAQSETTLFRRNVSFWILGVVLSGLSGLGAQPLGSSLQPPGSPCSRAPCKLLNYFETNLCLQFLKEFILNDPFGKGTSWYLLYVHIASEARDCSQLHFFSILHIHISVWWVPAFWCLMKWMCESCRKQVFLQSAVQWLPCFEPALQLYVATYSVHPSKSKGHGRHKTYQNTVFPLDSFVSSSLPGRVGLHLCFILRAHPVGYRQCLRNLRILLVRCFQIAMIIIRSQGDTPSMWLRQCLSSFFDAFHTTLWLLCMHYPPINYDDCIQKTKVQRDHRLIGFVLNNHQIFSWSTGSTVFVLASGAVWSTLGHLELLS